MGATMSAAANNGMSTTIIPPCSAASFEVNSEPHTGARPSVRLCVGPELARCVHHQVAMENKRGLWRKLTDVLRRIDQDIATRAAVRIESSTNSV
jgi:hypothetical protein